MGHLRKYLAWILAALCAFLPATALGVENRHTQITTTLPRAHTITVVCGEGGAVRVGETVYTGTRNPLPRNGWQPSDWKPCRKQDTA